MDDNVTVLLLCVNVGIKSFENGKKGRFHNIYIYRFVFQTQLRFSSGSDTYYIMSYINFLSLKSFVFL